MFKPLLALSLFCAFPAVADTCWSIADQSLSAQGVPTKICVSKVEIVSLEQGCRNLDQFEAVLNIDGKSQQGISIDETRWATQITLAQGGDDDLENPGGYRWSVTGRLPWSKKQGTSTVELESMQLHLEYTPHARESGWGIEAYGFSTAYQKQP